MCCELRGDFAEVDRPLNLLARLVYSVMAHREGVEKPIFLPLGAMIRVQFGVADLICFLYGGAKFMVFAPLHIQILVDY